MNLCCYWIRHLFLVLVVFSYISLIIGVELQARIPHANNTIHSFLRYRAQFLVIYVYVSSIDSQQKFYE